ncbi:myb family DNA-binding domain containing protein [Entamoeba histolytica HM-1:IMSS-B]|uniref:Myb-like DNA-binding domain containing protein n=6 Tax=Entamoeba histolytica TaxID=5759 RepID=C4LXE9_ENTH1|nr:myb-like DNA-binding domain containing protein [Entamoeba histolytica HM-1:IMSS]EMD48076.1 myb family DNAbinding domain containing protein [Entamoeba histolytica KU27]EMH74903.1 myb family DNA-binding domain containing protein [Entamoeba histolytica HM-1:IMSS-B]EMS15887.1 myb family DNA-binding domain containing protein [Entamoeba histolytica HM-3:IMSS]ENY62267.1 myb family DNA-binding domain containing protein [Entamoeba histolytica HM-1:IMSS-A]GAT93426.1 myb-like DNA-binding domain contai|eukprot:XP_648186.1 myb-like DNA-binding domain containing protein [Entamoeba histolytica HM-1:IMSS]
MELDADFITFTNILNGYYTILEECNCSVNSALKECQTRIDRVIEAMNAPRQLYKIREQYFTDIDGNSPLFFEKAPSTPNKIISFQWKKEDRITLLNIVNKIKVMILNQKWNQMIQERESNGLIKEFELRILEEKRRIAQLQKIKILEEAEKAKQNLEQLDVLNKQNSKQCHKYQNIPPPVELPIDSFSKEIKKEPESIEEIPKHSKLTLTISLKRNENKHPEMNDNNLTSILEEMRSKPSDELQKIIDKFNRIYPVQYNEKTELYLQQKKTQVELEGRRNIFLALQYKRLFTQEEFLKYLRAICDAIVIYYEMFKNEFRVNNNIDISDNFWKIICEEIGNHNPLDCKLQYDYIIKSQVYSSLEKIPNIISQIKIFAKKLNNPTITCNKESFITLKNEMMEFAEDHGMSYVFLLKKIQEIRMKENMKYGPFSKEEDEKILEAVKKYGKGDWKSVETEIEGRTCQQVMNRYDKVLIRKTCGKWSQIEKVKVTICQKLYPNQWKKISTFIPNRTDAQIRDFVSNSAASGVKKRKSWTEEEDLILIEKLYDPNYIYSIILPNTPEAMEKGKPSKIKVERSGKPKWSKIASQIPGRVDCQCRGRYDAILKFLKVTTKPSKSLMLEAASQLRGDGIKRRRSKKQIENDLPPIGYPEITKKLKSQLRLNLYSSKIPKNIQNHPPIHQSFQSHTLKQSQSTLPINKSHQNINKP